MYARACAALLVWDHFIARDESPQKIKKPVEWDWIVFSLQGSVCSKGWLGCLITWNVQEHDIFIHFPGSCISGM